jgi:hypothetical protein
MLVFSEHSRFLSFTNKSEYQDIYEIFFKLELYNEKQKEYYNIRTVPKYIDKS